MYVTGHEPFLCYGQDETWLADNPADRPIVKLTDMEASPAAAVLREYADMIHRPTTESLQLLRGSLSVV